MDVWSPSWYKRHNAVRLGHRQLPIHKRSKYFAQVNSLNVLLEFCLPSRVIWLLGWVKGVVDSFLVWLSPGRRWRYRWLVCLRWTSCQEVEPQCLGVWWGMWWTMDRINFQIVCFCCAGWLFLWMVFINEFKKWFMIWHINAIELRMHTGSLRRC